MLVDVPGIPLRRRDGSVIYTLVDPEDFVWLNDIHWCVGGNGYVRRNIINARGQRSAQYMHRAILGLSTDDPRVGDHISGDRLDNRRANLRCLTNAENAQNRRVLRVPGRTSRFRGVGRTSDGSKWYARVNLDGRIHYFGRFDSEEQAALVASAFRAQHMPFAVEGGGA